ncbi:MAG: hypothetical protein LBT29_02430 [Flavobacteriaceae bacterium]|jgi:hypothetical protein|nr:hypothetical protein [Flavobacteriaceae bacterium]
MGKTVFKTDFKLGKEAKELAIFNEWNELVKQPGSMKTAIDEYLMEKYDIFSKSTIWFIRKRVEKRLAAQSKESNNN